MVKRLKKERGDITIDFGTSESLSRILVEQYRKNRPHGSLSQLVRKLVVTHLSSNPNFTSSKVVFAFGSWIQTKREMKAAQERLDSLRKERANLERQLKSWGITEEELTVSQLNESWMRPVCDDGAD